jgi:hypothetical protein
MVREALENNLLVTGFSGLITLRYCTFPAWCASDTTDMPIRYGLLPGAVPNPVYEKCLAWQFG